MSSFASLRISRKGRSFASLRMTPYCRSWFLKLIIEGPDLAPARSSCCLSLFNEIERRKLLLSFLAPISYLCTILPMPGRHNFGHDRQRHLLGRGSSYIQANGPMDALDLLFRYSLAFQALITLFFCLETTDGTDVAHLVSKRHFERGFVELGIVCQYR